MTILMIVELLIVLLALWVGARYGSLALGAISGIGLAILVGTGHVVYTLMPIICDIALKKGIRPEHPCGIASIASQIGITCSPIAAAVVAFSTISIEHGFHVSNVQIILVTIPACLIGILCAVAMSWHGGLDLDKDPKFLEKLKDPAQKAYIYGNTATTLDKKIAPESKRAVYIFLVALAFVVIISVASMMGINLLPSYPKTLEDGSVVMKPLAMNIVIQITMIAGLP